MTKTHYDNYAGCPVTAPASGYMLTPKGQVTWGEAKVLGTGSFVVTASYYDDKYRVVQQSIDGPDIDLTTTNTYDFVGNLTQSIEAYTGQVNATITKDFTYDHAGRLEKVEQEIEGDGDNGKVVLAENHYNELGQLMLKKLHSANDTSFVQDIDYLYDVRGWLTKINNFADTTSMKLYAQSLAYNANGNISNINWKNTLLNNDGWIDPTSKMEYTFAYDNLNRLGTATYKEYLPAGGSNSGYFDTNYGYDLNGNITGLSRKGNVNDSNAPSPSYNYIDNLAYTYNANSNQLGSVSDAASGVGHGLHYMQRTGIYTYDANGNATYVPHSGAAIVYSHLNLPDQIAVAGQGTINYLYDAAGNKLRKRFNGADTYYQGSVLKINGQPIVLTGEGRAVYANSMWNYEYDLKDHLGNTRVSFGINTVKAKPLQYKDYYPFGMEMAQWYKTEGSPTKYLYNGKELQDEGGLGWYDYQNRFMDPALGRWHVVDPHAENYLSWTPYNYVANNPMLLIDPDGMDWYKYTDDDGNEHYKYQDGDDETIDVDGNTYSNIGSSVSININDDVYLNAFQNLTMTSYGESVDLKSKILNDNSLFYDYIKDGSDLSLQGRSELFNSRIRKAMREDGTQIIMGIGAVTGGVIAAGELAALTPLLGDAATSYLTTGEVLNNVKGAALAYRYATSNAMRWLVYTETGQYVAATGAALLPEGARGLVPGIPINSYYQNVVEFWKTTTELLFGKNKK